MKVVSFNVNGIRAAQKKGFEDWLQQEQFDIIGLQETKAWPEQVDISKIEDLGYQMHWVNAEKKGYSGVALICKEQPKHIELESGIDLFDTEGRVILAQFEQFTVINAYFPSGTTGDIRQDVKYEFLEKFFQYLDQKRQEFGPILVMGDYNICHKAIDIHNPKNNKNTSGFLPEERAWMDQYFENGMIDTFRKFHPETPDKYSWWSYRAGSRAKNKGWRIDYIAASQDLDPFIYSADILSEVVMSDHCPILTELRF